MTANDDNNTSSTSNKQIASTPENLRTVEEYEADLKKAVQAAYAAGLEAGRREKLNEIREQI